MRILDFGCGSGGFDEITEDRKSTTSWLQANSFGKEFAVGIDPNPGRIKEASSKINAHFVVADGKSLPFRQQTFDIVHETGVFHHVKNYQLAIDEISRVLRQGGLLVAKEAVDNDPIFALGRRIVGKWHGDKIESYFSSDELVANLEKVFVLRKVNYYCRLPLSHALLYFGIPEPNVSLRFHDVLNRLLTKLGLCKRVCSEFHVEMEKR